MRESDPEAADETGEIGMDEEQESRRPAPDGGIIPRFLRRPIGSDGQPVTRGGIIPRFLRRPIGSERVPGERPAEAVSVEVTGPEAEARGVDRLVGRPTGVEEVARQRTERRVESHRDAERQKADALRIMEEAVAGIQTAFDAVDGRNQFLEAAAEMWHHREKARERRDRKVDAGGYERVYTLSDYAVSEDDFLQRERVTLAGLPVPPAAGIDDVQVTNTETVLHQHGEGKDVGELYSESGFERHDTLSMLTDPEVVADYKMTEVVVDSVPDLVAHRARTYDLAADMASILAADMEETSENARDYRQEKRAAERKLARMEKEEAVDPDRQAELEETVAAAQNELEKAENQNLALKHDRDLYRADQEQLVSATGGLVDTFYDEEGKLGERIDMIEQELAELAAEDGIMHAIRTNFEDTVSPLTAASDGDEFRVETDAEENLDMLYEAFNNKRKRLGGPFAEEEGVLDSTAAAYDVMVRIRHRLQESESGFYEEVRAASDLARYEEEMDTLAGRFFNLADDGTVDGYSQLVSDIQDEVDQYVMAQADLGDPDAYETLSDPRDLPQV